LPRGGDPLEPLCQGLPPRHPGRWRFAPRGLFSCLRCVLLLCGCAGLARMSAAVGGGPVGWMRRSGPVSLPRHRPGPAVVGSPGALRSFFGCHRRAAECAGAGFPRAGSWGEKTRPVEVSTGRVGGDVVRRTVPAPDVAGRALVAPDPGHHRSGPPQMRRASSASRSITSLSLPSGTAA